MCGNDGCKEGAVLAEGADEALGDEVEDTAFLVSQAVRLPACGYDGVVVGDLRAVKDLTALSERVLYQSGKLSVLPRYASQYVGAFGIDVITEVSGIDPRIGRDLLLIETLYSVERRFR